MVPRDARAHRCGVAAERGDVLQQPYVVAGAPRGCGARGRAPAARPRGSPDAGQLAAAVERPHHQRHRAHGDTVQRGQVVRVELRAAGPSQSGDEPRSAPRAPARAWPQAQAGAHAGTGRPSSSRCANRGGPIHSPAVGRARSACRSSSSVCGRAIRAAMRLRDAGLVRQRHAGLGSSRAQSLPPSCAAGASAARMCGWRAAWWRAGHAREIDGQPSVAASPSRRCAGAGPSRAAGWQQATTVPSKATTGQVQAGRVRPEVAAARRPDPVHPVGRPSRPGLPAPRRSGSDRRGRGRISAIARSRYGSPAWSPVRCTLTRWPSSSRLRSSASTAPEAPPARGSGRCSPRHGQAAPMLARIAGGIRPERREEHAGEQHRGSDPTPLPIAASSATSRGRSSGSPPVSDTTSGRWSGRKRRPAAGTVRPGAARRAASSGSSSARSAAGSAASG